MPPVLTAIPPGRGLGSTTTTRLPKNAAWAAPFSPAGPAPITTRSYGVATARLPGLTAALAGDRPHASPAGVFEQRAAHARGERADVHHGFPAAVRHLVLGARRN